MDSGGGRGLELLWRALGRPDVGEDPGLDSGGGPGLDFGEALWTGDALERTWWNGNALEEALDGNCCGGSRRTGNRWTRSIKTTKDK